MRLENKIVKRKTIFEPFILTFSSGKYFLIAVISSIVMAFLAILIPSLLTPGNTLKFQLSLLQLSDIGLIILFSSLFGIAVAMQSYASYREKIQKNKFIIKSTGTGFVAFTATLFSAKLCPICLGAILGFVGIGSSATLFLFSYKNEILITSIFILIFTIYLTGRRITNLCNQCK